MMFPAFVVLLLFTLAQFTDQIPAVTVVNNYSLYRRRFEDYFVVQTIDVIKDSQFIDAVTLNVSMFEQNFASHIEMFCVSHLLLVWN